MPYNLDKNGINNQRKTVFYWRSRYSLTVESMKFKKEMVRLLLNTKNNIGIIKVDDNHKNIVYEIKDNGCHEIISHASSGNSGYFKIKINGKAYDIHRWYYIKIHPEIDMTNLDVRHKCDNRQCINPDHLEHGTRKENVNDMLIRNRQYSELSEQEVFDIINKYNTGIYNYADLSKIYGVVSNTIRHICMGKTWKHLTGIKLDDYQSIHNKSEKQSDEKYIYWDKINYRWRVVILVNGNKINIGRFKDLREAITERDKGLLRYNNIIL